MNGNQPAIQGFMIPVNELDFQTSLGDSPRNICSSAIESTIGAPWYTCENIKFTGTVGEVTARVGDNVTIKVGLQALPTEEPLEQVITSVAAWVCYPNTVTGGADAMLVVPSMQPPNPFPNYDWGTSGTPIADAPHVFNNMSYRTGNGFLWQPLGPWIPTEEDFMDQSEHSGHCCIIANASGLIDWTPTSSAGPVGFQFNAISELNAHIDVCTDLYQGQRNVIIVPTSGGGRRRIPPRIGFLAGAPKQTKSFKTSVAVTALKQGDRIDPVLLNALKSGPYAGLPLKAATLPPRSLRLSRHDCKWNGWLCKIIHEAEEVIEELLGLATHPFGGGHRLQLSLPAHGLHPLHVEVELDPTEPPGTVHSIEITQTDANGARGGIRAGVVVT